MTVLTVATDDNHGLQRYLRSAKVYGINVEVLGQGAKWVGGDMNYAGGGQKVNLLKTKLNEMKTSDKEHIILYTDGFVLLCYLKKSDENSTLYFIEFIEFFNVNIFAGMMLCSYQN